jgi:hypothetical protein
MVCGVCCMAYGVWVYSVWVYNVCCMGVCCTVVSPAELTNQTAPNKLHQTNCTKQTAPNKLHQTNCTKQTAPHTDCNQTNGFTDSRTNGSSTKSTALPPNQRLYHRINGSTLTKAAEVYLPVFLSSSHCSTTAAPSNCCHSVVTVWSQCCHSVVTVLSQCCHSVVTVLSQCPLP